VPKTASNVRYIASTMKRSIRVVLAIVVVAIVVAVAAVVATNHSSPTAAPPLVSHTIHPTRDNDVALQLTFLTYNKEMVSTDHVTWGQILQNGPHQPLIAYDALDKRTWAIASFNLVTPASYKAEVSFQDGGNMGIFYKVGVSKWIMTGSPGFPLCAKDVPKTVAQLWGLKNYPACN
jgi:ABC-type transport system substrate-binding protein